MVKIKRKIYIPIFIIAVLAVTYFYYMTREPQAHQTCPEDFPETDAGFQAKTDSMEKWINNFYDKNPGSSLAEMAKARFAFYLENNCTKAIERYNEAKNGKADPATMQLIRDTIIDNN